jgi:hypothetical protein
MVSKWEEGRFTLPIILFCLLRPAQIILLFAPHHAYILPMRQA